MRIIDLTFDIETGMPTCGTPWHQTVEIEPMGTIDTVGRNTARILLGSHSGTHMDAPRHFVEDGDTIEALDINMLWGEASVIDMRHKGNQGDVVELEDVKKITVSERMIFVFGWYHNWKTDKYYKSFPYFSVDAVNYLIDNGMKFMAMDTPSPDDGSAISSREDDSPNHKILLNKKIVMVEYLNNTDELSPDKKYEIAAFPLKAMGSDGCPARVLIKEF